ncbi:hypothetical protein BYT27DRAFT_7222765 [Phlegmacium glaucopus]|nr:hypothetical protein BYT27DRAFT_7222765 [Phlegmacium glaucopus]
MPTTSRKQQIAAAHAKGQEALAEKWAILASETATNDLLSRLQAANSHIEVLEQLLSQKEIECGRLQSELEKSNENLQKHKDSSALWKAMHEKIYHELHMQRQSTKRGQEKLAKLEEQLEIIKIAEKEASKQLLRGSHESYQALILLRKENKDLQRELSKSLEKTHAKLATLNLDLKTLHGKASKLCKAVVCFREQKKQAMDSIEKKIFHQQSVHHLMCKGVFTEETHNVVCLLIISAVLKSAGITTGFFAAQIQLGYEMKGAESMTFSADGTGYRSINYKSRHVHLVQQVTQTFGAIADWENTLKKIIDLYNESPLGKRTGSLLKYELKAWAENMLDMSFEEVAEHFKKAEEKMIRKAGGPHKWKNIPDIKKAERKAAMIEEAVAELGKEAFNDLSDEEKCIFQIFIWAGCGCHKDLNTVRGGYLAIVNWWNENKSEEVECPILLANCDNDPVVQERVAALEQGDTPTPAQERAFHKSTHGGIKTAEIAGAIFNHKDDKKGHHDVFHYWWWEHVGIPFTFPDTSNNRFQSYCDASAALILYTDKFKEFLENLLNHMESNLCKALHCNSTITELAVLAIYAEAVSYPYMKAICTSSDKDQNMLDIGPLHSRVYDHMQKIIENPDILIGKDLDPLESYKMATLDGEKWQNTAVVNKILDLIPTLPHFCDLLIAFFKGAAETWEHFTSEFAPGGLIDEATAEERELAWMPASNDENGGFLGNAKATAEWIAQLDLIFDKEKIPSLKGAPNLKQGALPTKVGDICKALIDAIDLYTKGTWKLVPDEDSDTEDTDYEGEEEEEEDWEDIE